MGDTSSGQLAYVKETVAGTTPATPAFKVVDITSEDLAMSATQIRSNAVSPQRVVRGSRRASSEVGGGFNFELYKGAEIDALLASLLGDSFAGTPLTAKAGGSTVDTYTFERKLGAADYRRFTGVRIGSMEFTVSPEAFVGVRVGCVGFSMQTAAAAIAGSTYAPASDTEKLTSLDVTAITLSNGLTASLDYETLSFTVNNQLTARKRIGPNSVRGIGQGLVLVTGSMRAYVDKALADAFVAETAFDMDVPFVNAGEGYTALFKNVRITSYADPNSGNGDEFMGNIEFEATLDSTFASSFGFSKTT
jgi:hypothetical protein